MTNTLDTPVISRLIEAGKRKTTDLSDGKDRVILFVRQVHYKTNWTKQQSYLISFIRRRRTIAA